MAARETHFRLVRSRETEPRRPGPLVPILSSTTRILMSRQRRENEREEEKGDRSRITTGYRWSFRRCHVVYANYFSVTNHFLANCLSRDCYTSIRFGEASGPLESFDLLESTCAAIVRVTYWPIADNQCARANPSGDVLRPSGI